MITAHCGGHCQTRSFLITSVLSAFLEDINITPGSHDLADELCVVVVCVFTFRFSQTVIDTDIPVLCL